jgi:hypothetical protein
MGHPLAGPFLFKLNEEYLGDLFESYNSLIKDPIDFITISEKLNEDYYNDTGEFLDDSYRVFSNCKKFNAKNSEYFLIANQLENYFMILIKPIYTFLEKNNNHKIEMDLKVNFFYIYLLKILA